MPEAVAVLSLKLLSPRLLQILKTATYPPDPINFLVTVHLLFSEAQHVFHCACPKPTSRIMRVLTVTFAAQSEPDADLLIRLAYEQQVDFRGVSSPQPPVSELSARQTLHRVHRCCSTRVGTC